MNNRRIRRAMFFGGPFRSGSLDSSFSRGASSRRRLFAHTYATLDAHLHAQRCHWLNEQEASNEIFLREFSPTRAGNTLWRVDVWIGMALGLSFLREMRLGVHTSSFIRRKPSCIPDTSIRRETQKGESCLEKAYNMHLEKNIYKMTGCELF